MNELFVSQDGAKPGSVLMSEDAELLERAERGELAPTLRFYEWDVPTLSLGFHQSEEQLDMERIVAGRVPWVRRPTGGAAVLHSDELTYAIVLPDCAAPAAASRVQEYVSRSIANGLCALGVKAAADERGEPLTALQNRVSCFVRTSRWEVTAGGRKLVGSAQRKLTRAILQHGSILVGADHLRITDFLKMSDETARQNLRERLEHKATCITAELGRRVEMSEIRRAMEMSFRDLFGEYLAAVRETPVGRQGLA